MEVSYDELHSVAELGNTQPPVIEPEDLVGMHLAIPLYGVPKKLWFKSVRIQLPTVRLEY